MNEKKETSDTIDDQFNPEQDIHLENRKEQDRRRESSKGFAYISIVGWIDRREKIRRKDDPLDF